MTHKASVPSPELPHPVQPGAAHYLDLSELPDCLSVRVSVSIRTGDPSRPERAPGAATSAPRPLPR